MEKHTDGITRRAFSKTCIKMGAGVAALLSGCTQIWQKKHATETPVSCTDNPLADEYEYIVVGSGAGGGSLAANLARKGHRVLLMEAGGDVDNDKRFFLLQAKANKGQDITFTLGITSFNGNTGCLK